MPDSNVDRLRRGPAVPLTLTVQRDSSYWVIRAFYHGNTIHEALHPVLVAERWLSANEAPPNATWHQLYTAVAIAMSDLAEINNGFVDGHYHTPR